VDDLLVHDEKDSTLAFILGDMTYNPEVPRPLGIFQSLERPSYDDSVHKQIEYEVETKGEGDIMELMKGRESWDVKNINPDKILKTMAVSVMVFLF
jgi:2-oxoglutarate ferredoxin oxidoreductase subunit beta